MRGKRADKRAESRPEISDRLMDMVKDAKASLGTAKPTEASEHVRPQASPARLRKAPQTIVEQPKQTPAQSTPGPASMQSTPVKSPDLKKLKSTISETSSSQLPSLPSFSSKSDASTKLHGLDSQTMLDMADYFSQMRLSGLNSHTHMLTVQTPIY